MSMYKCEDCGEWIGLGEPHRECAAIVELRARVAELESKNEDLESDLRMAMSCGCDARKYGK